MHGGVDNRFKDSSTAKVVFFFETNGFSTHKCAKITLLSFSGTPHPFFYASSRLLPSSGFPPRRKVENFAEKDHSFADKTDCFLPRKRGISGMKKQKKYPREKMHHVLAQPRAKRHTPTWTNVPEACTTDSIIYRKINSTTKGTSYSQKEPSPLGWAISPKKKKRARKRIKTTGFQHGRGGVVRQSRPHKSPVGGRKEEQRGGKEQNGGKRIDNHIKNERNARHVLRKP